MEINITDLMKSLKSVRLLGAICFPDFVKDQTYIPKNLYEPKYKCNNIFGP